MSVLVSMGAWLFFGSPGGSGQDPSSQVMDGWRLIPGQQADTPRCRFEGGWAALEYQGDSLAQVGQDLHVQPGERWEFEDGWEAANVQWALAGDPVPDSPQEDMTEIELAERLQNAPAHWDYGERTACVEASGPSQQPPQ